MECVSAHSSAGNDGDNMYSYLNGFGNRGTGVLFHFRTTEMFYNANAATTSGLLKANNAIARAGTPQGAQ